MAPAPASARTTAMDWVRRLAALLCLGSAYQCAVTGFEQHWLTLLIVSALVIATGPAHWLPLRKEPRPVPWPNRRTMWSNFAPGWLLMVVAASSKLLGVAPQIVVCTWLSGAAWVLTGAWLASQGTTVAEEPRSGFPLWAWVMLVVTIGATLRLWEIGTVPRYVHCDEGTITLTARQFYADPARDWFAPPPKAGSYSIMHLHFALAGAGTLIFGFNLPGARAADAFLGICSIALMFCGLRRVATLRVAVVGALLLAANHCHLAYSRIASGYIQTAFVVALVFAIFSRVWTTPTYANAALLGIVLALGIQTYPASLVALPLFILTMSILAVLRPQRCSNLATPAAIFLLTLLASGAPFAAAVWQHGDVMFNRSRAINIFSPQKMQFLKDQVYHTDSAAEVVAKQAWNSLLGFHRGRDTQPQYGIDRPMAEPYTAALMIPGVIFTLFSLRHFVSANTLVITVGYLLLGLGMQFAPGHNRATGALPLGMALPAIGLVQCFTTLLGEHRLVTRVALSLCLVGALALCIRSNLHTYFVYYPRSLITGDAESEAGWITRDNAQRYTVHLASWPMPPSGGYEGLRVIVADVPFAHNDKRSALEYVKDVELTGSDLFIINAENKEAIEVLRKRFPEARFETFRRHPVMGPELVLAFIGEPRVGSVDADDSDMHPLHEP